MNFLQSCTSKLSLKRSFMILSSLLLVASPKLGASSLPEPVCPLQRISPIPGPANPDPVLQNLQVVMDDFFQKPYYPGLTPYPSNYLGGVYGQFNTYTSGYRFVYNPLNDKIMSLSIGQNNIVDLTGTLINYQRIASNTVASSKDGGLSWIYGPPIEQIIPLGGTISQIINASIGPGLHLTSLKNGNLIAWGNGFKDMHPNPPFQVPMMGALFTYSKNNGKTWAAPKILLPSDVDYEFADSFGLGFGDMYITPDPANIDHLVATTTSILLPSTFYGNGYAFSSYDGGLTFSPPKQVYSMIDDPLWLADHFDPDFTFDPNYFQFGGQLLGSYSPTYVDKNTILISFVRLYPKVGSTTYTQSGEDSDFDQATIRSQDNGKTWSKVASPTEPITNPFFPPHDPGTGRNLSAGVYSAPLVVSPYTGRVYMAYQSGNPAAPDPEGFPSILLSRSLDKGGCWGHPVQINATPKNISFDRQQAFAHSMIMTQDGSLVVAYYDLRNWTGFFGEDPATTPLPIDAWLAVYKELDDPHGGSTGLGLDFVGEIRLTPFSSDARISANTINGRVGFACGTPEGMPLIVNRKNVLFVVFSMSGEADPANIKPGYLGMTIDTNNRTNIFLQRFQFPKPSNQ